MGLTPVPQWQNTGGAIVGTAFADVGALAASGAISALQNVSSMIPVVGAIASSIITLIKLFFKGANPNQVPSAMDEQVYEAASDNAYALCKAGFIDKSTALTINNTLAQLGSQTLQQLQARVGNLGGLQNMINTLNAESMAIEGLPERPLVTFSVEQAHALYIQPGTKGWYAQSLQQAAQLTDQILSTYVAASSTSPGNLQEAVPQNTALPPGTLAYGGGGLQQASPGQVAGNITTAALQGNLAPLEANIMSNPILWVGIALIAFLALRRG